MAKQWRCAVIGTGVIGSLHVRILSQMPNRQLVAVCDIKDTQGRKALDEQKVSVPIYTDLEEMLRKEKLDAVHVCTPSGDHRDPSITAMRHGLNVICEKPLEILPERVDEMIEASKKHGVKLAGMFQCRWIETNRILHDAVKQGRFGRLAWAGTFTPWYRTDKYYEEGNWRGTWKLDGGGAVMNQGVHQVDLLQWVMGPVKTVSAFSASRIHAKIEVEDTLTCSMQFENGAFGSYVSSTAMWPGGTVRMEVGGEFGSAVSENYPTRLSRFEFQKPEPGDKELLERYGPATTQKSTAGSNPAGIGSNLHFQNIEAIYQSWDKGEEAETCGPEARKAVVIIKAMYESARKKGAPVDVKN